MANELFCISGGQSKEPRRYENCGLDNIWLMDGYEVVSRNGEQFIQVQDRADLHKAIALHLVRYRKALGGREIKFIRRAIDMTQGELAQQLGTSTQTVARWEKSQVNIPGPEERLLRFTTVFAIVEPTRFAEILQAMPALMEHGDEGPELPARFKHDAHALWTEAHAVAA